MAEWFKAVVLKTIVFLKITWVQIPFFPFFIIMYKNMINCLYLLLTFIVAQLVALGYYNIYTITIKHEDALKDYKVSSELLRSNLLQLRESSLEIIRKNDSLVENPLNTVDVTVTDKVEIATSPGVEIIDTFSQGTVFGAILFAISIFLVLSAQQEFRRAFRTHFLADTNFRRIFMGEIIMHKNQANIKLTKLIENLETIEPALFKACPTDRIYFQNLRYTIEALIDFKEKMLADCPLFLKGELRPLIEQSLELLDGAAHHLMVLEIRTIEMEQLLMFVQEVEANLRLSTVITGIGI
jgi:hypothetical protein